MFYSNKSRGCEEGHNRGGSGGGQSGNQQNKIRIQIISKITLVMVEDNLEAGGAREVKASKGSKVMLYVIIVEEQVICKLLVTGDRMI